ncbi:Derlin {ECO:0000256/RuleBase:RU363059} [Serendipita indica DSM 11827]|uniref:Derlin n=1 Tax=Serendipita indica (strain DSM 11827) TaxID=1109443 RepID=G4TDY7_SERID|nr:Derlin {ECO:0000256/RuleBase:RU363059} [Serendipita indica DSM 11827]CCA69514.1 hypothetical protein PIIN_03453 [Serendipita indica DSM 11827]
MSTDIVAEINKIPPVTRVIIVSSCLIALPIFFHLASPLWYHLDYGRVTAALQIYRLYTCLLVPSPRTSPFSWLFSTIMLFQHLKRIEEKDYHRRLPDMVWQFALSSVAIFLLAQPLDWAFFQGSFICFVVYLSSRLSPNEKVSLMGLLHIDVKYFPYVLVAFETMSSPRSGCVAMAGLIVAQVLLMIEYDLPLDNNTLMQPRLKPKSWLRAPGWLCNLLLKPEPRQRVVTEQRVYGSATAPSGRGVGDGGRGANATTSSGYNWGRGNRLGES